MHVCLHQCACVTAYNWCPCGLITLSSKSLGGEDKAVCHLNGALRFRAAGELKSQQGVRCGAELLLGHIKVQFNWGPSFRQQNPWLPAQRLESLHVEKDKSKQHN